MHPNEQLIQTFYKAFQEKDYKTMQRCYGEEATFTDPVFADLNATQVRAMWEMFCVNGKDLSIEFKNIKASETNGNAEWIATYIFTKTGRKVTNHIYSTFTIKEGKIHIHFDKFNFYKWSVQALGIPGLLLGWTGFIKRKIQEGGMKSLNHYIAGNKL